MRDMLGRNTFPFVLNREQDMFRAALLERDFHRGRFAAIFKSIVDKIANQLFKLLRVAFNCIGAFGLKFQSRLSFRPCSIDSRSFNERSKINGFLRFFVLFSFYTR